MLKYYIDDFRIIIPTLEGNKEYAITLLIDENLNVVTYSFREEQAYEVMLTKVSYKLGFIPEVEASPKTKRIVDQIIERLTKLNVLVQIISHSSAVYNGLDNMRLEIDRILKSFVHEYKPNAEMKANEKRIGTDGKMYQARYALNCQDCCFESDACLHLQIGLGSCSAGNRLNNHDNIIFKIIE